MTKTINFCRTIIVCQSNYVIAVVFEFLDTLKKNSIKILYSHKLSRPIILNVQYSLNKAIFRKNVYFWYIYCYCINIVVFTSFITFKSKLTRIMVIKRLFNYCSVIKLFSSKSLPSKFLQTRFMLAPYSLWYHSFVLISPYYIF